ncbi:hypothetical protein H0H93_006985 [Arthromyces matolae]|nr:hypothetical protein H0H93_006985 [Arthromyces matolae]
MSFRRSPISFLGALGVALTTLAVGYGTYRYFRAQGAQRPPVYSGCKRPPLSQNHTVSRTQYPAQSSASDDESTFSEDSSHLDIPNSPPGYTSPQSSVQPSQDQLFQPVDERSSSESNPQHDILPPYPDELDDLQLTSSENSPRLVNFDDPPLESAQAQPGVYDESSPEAHPPAHAPAPSIETPPPAYNDISPAVGSPPPLPRARYLPLPEEQPLSPREADASWNYTYPLSSANGDSSSLGLLGVPTTSSSSQFGVSPSQNHTFWPEEDEESLSESIPLQTSTSSELGDLQLTASDSSTQLVSFGSSLEFAQAQPGLSDESPLEAHPQREIQLPHLQTTSVNDDTEDEVQLEGLGFTPEQLVSKSCAVSMDPSTRTIKLVIQTPVDDSLRLESSYLECRDALNSSPNIVKVLATVTEEHDSSFFSLKRLGQALERLAADDTRRRCKYLKTELPQTSKMGFISNYGDLPPLTLPEIQTLEWRSDQEPLYLMDFDHLNCLTHLTLETHISFQDCLYLLHRVSGTLRECTVGDLDGVQDSVFPSPWLFCTSVYLPQIGSFSIKSHSCPIAFLNRLGFCGKKLRKFTLEVQSHENLNPAEIQSIPWAVIKNIKLDCNIVSGGADWVRRKAVKAESCMFRRLLTKQE